MADFYDVPDPYNYLIGGNVVSFNGANLGNVESCIITPIANDVENIYNAVTGRVGPDEHDTPEEVVSEISGIEISLTLDELDRSAFHIFFGGANNGANTVVPLLRRRIKGSLSIEGVSVTGMNFLWDIPIVTITPDSNFSYSAENWVNYQLRATAFPDTNTPNAPYGQIELLGANLDA